MTDPTLTRDIAEASLGAAIPRSEADPVAATRQVLSELRHAAADLIRRWSAAYPSEAATDPQIGLQAAGNGVNPPHRN
jgi:hypothetical protein